MGIQYLVTPVLITEHQWWITGIMTPVCMFCGLYIYKATDRMYPTCRIGLHAVEVFHTLLSAEHLGYRFPNKGKVGCSWYGCWSAPRTHSTLHL